MIWVFVLIALAVAMTVVEEKAPIFLLKRLLGLAQIADGLVMLVSGRSFALSLRVAKRIARIRGDRMMKQSAADKQRRVDGLIERWNK